MTGAFGFVGRYVARACAARGDVVRGIGHGSWSRAEWRPWGLSEWHEGSIGIEQLVTNAGEPDLIFHCAGSGSVAFSMTHPYQDFQRTVGTTLSVLEYMRLHAPSVRLVVPSSAGVYGAAETMPLMVGDVLNPVSPYGLHKKMSEEICASYARHFALNAAVVRLFSVYGIGLRKQLLWDACTKISAGILDFAGTGDETRDWIHVEDAASLMLAASDAASPLCPVVNGGAGHGMPIRAVIAQIAHLCTVDAPLRFSGQARPGDPVHYEADITEASALGWKPQREMAAEVATYVDWFKKGAP